MRWRPLAPISNDFTCDSDTSSTYSDATVADSSTTDASNAPFAFVHHVIVVRKK